MTQDSPLTPSFNNFILSAYPHYSTGATLAHPEDGKETWYSVFFTSDLFLEDSDDVMIATFDHYSAVKAEFFGYRIHSNVYLGTEIYSLGKTLVKAYRYSFDSRQVLEEYLARLSSGYEEYLK